ncbi:hypothetical protein M5K25_003611 [Dendrobium thyrsiflorum]|uniref:GDT1 family protein n=1 Tax=Dendrobium thyrsiflorum TaxID=117978 RepID=A0ABD0VJM8_DENTH
MAAKKVDALEERLEGEMNQIKTTVEERMSSMEGQVADLRDMIKKMLEVHNQTTASVARNGEGRSTNSEIPQAELAISELRGNGAGITAAASTVISTFFLVFVAEWGDKSFFSTIALAAASSPLGVIGGALAGHAFATLLAVLGGSLLGTYVSEKVLAQWLIAQLLINRL